MKKSGAGGGGTKPGWGRRVSGSLAGGALGRVPARRWKHRCFLPGPDAAPCSGDPAFVCRGFRGRDYPAGATRPGRPRGGPETRRPASFVDFWVCGSTEDLFARRGKCPNNEELTAFVTSRCSRGPLGPLFPSNHLSPAPSLRASRGPRWPAVAQSTAAEPGAKPTGHSPQAHVSQAGLLALASSIPHPRPSGGLDHRHLSSANPENRTKSQGAKTKTYTNQEEKRDCTRRETFVSGQREKSKD